VRGVAHVGLVRGVDLVGHTLRRRLADPDRLAGEVVLLVGEDDFDLISDLDGRDDFDDDDLELAFSRGEDTLAGLAQVDADELEVAIGGLVHDSPAVFLHLRLRTELGREMEIENLQHWSSSKKRKLLRTATPTKTRTYRESITNIAYQSTFVKLFK